MHLNAGNGSKELLGGQVLRQPREELRHVNEVHPGQDVLKQPEEAQGRAEQELLPVTAEHVPDPAGQVEGQGLAVESEDPGGERGCQVLEAPRRNPGSGPILAGAPELGPSHSKSWEWGAGGRALACTHAEGQFKHLLQQHDQLSQESQTTHSFRIRRRTARNALITNLLCVHYHSEAGARR